jgi:hypothetical protein
MWNILHETMRNLHILSATRRWHRSYRTLHFLRLFSVSFRLKITHCDTYSGRIWKDLEGFGRILCINAKFSIRHQFFSDENSTGAHIDNVFFCQNPIENCTQVFLRFDVSRDKSDVMTSFCKIDWSDVCRVFRQAGSSFQSHQHLAWPITLGVHQFGYTRLEQICVLPAREATVLSA